MLGMNTFLGLLYSPPVTILLGIVTSAIIFCILFVTQLGISFGVGMYSILSISNVITWSMDFTVAMFKTLFKDTIEPIEANIRKSFVFHGDATKGGLYIWHPHGLFACAPWIHAVTSMGTNSQKMSMATLPMYFRIPFLHDMFKMTGIINTNYETIRTHMNDGKPVGLVLGGVEEMFQVQPYTLNLVLKKRTGYLRLALETKKPIIPVLTYGENELFDAVPKLTNSELNRFLKRNFGIMIPFPSLESFTRWAKITEEPLSPIHTHVGEPVYPIESDTIETLRERYMKAIQELFDKTRPEGYTLNFM